MYHRLAGFIPLLGSPTFIHPIIGYNESSMQEKAHAIHFQQAADVPDVFQIVVHTDDVLDSLYFIRALTSSEF